VGGDAVAVEGTAAVEDLEDQEGEGALEGVLVGYSQISQ